MQLAYLKRLFAVAILSSVAIVAFAEDAPVYEVDSYPPFDSQQDAMENLPAQSFATDPGYVPPVNRRPNLSSSERLSRLEQQMNNMQQSTYSEKIENLQREVQSLRGQVEELTHQLQQTVNQQRSMYTDLDKRLSTDPASAAPAVKLAENSRPVVAREPAPAPAPVQQKPIYKVKSASQSATVSVKTPNAQPNVAEEQQIYQTAYDLIKSKKYNDAITTLQKMLQKYPSGQFAANAHYWLGELYGLINKNEQSAVEFDTVIKKYPESPKVSDAELKLGLIYAAQFKWVDAKSSFKKIINQYPGTTSARVASEQLKQIKQAGH